MRIYHILNAIAGLLIGIISAPFIAILWPLILAAYLWANTDMDDIE